jgi:uroporphyrin-3 C-methyltransferase
MNDQPPATDPVAPMSAPLNFAGASAETTGIVPPQRMLMPKQQISLALAIGVVAFLLMAQWWTSREDIHGLRQEVAHRLQSGDMSITETKLLAKEAQETSRELQAKLSVLENKQLESQSQQLALEQLYQDLSKNRDDWALAEIEQVLSTASQQLQLAGNVQGALIALQNADRTLSHSDKPQFITIRRAIAKDTERLKSLPILDLTGIALRLDSVIGQVDGLPLLSDEKPSAPSAARPKKPLRLLPPPKLGQKGQKGHAGKSTSAAVPDSGSPLGADWIARIEDVWQSWSHEMWVDVKQLIRVRNVETPDAMMMSPTQAYYMRENLKLRLLNARLALLSRNGPAFRSDMIESQDMIAKYFDTRAKQTQTAQTFLKQVQNSNLSIELPTLAESLNAVRNYKAKP